MSVMPGATTNTLSTTLLAGKSAMLQKLALAIPFLLFSGWVAQHDYAVRFSKTVRLKVIGYDPRDLISGRYLQFRVEYGSEVCSEPEKPNSCVCLAADSSGVSHSTWSGNCEQRPKADCEIYVRGACEKGRFFANLDRYYMPEWFAPFVESIPPDATIVAAIAANGVATVREFYVGSGTLSQFVEAMRDRRMQVQLTPTEPPPDLEQQPTDTPASQ